jgi:hypothetical protein
MGIVIVQEQEEHLSGSVKAVARGIFYAGAIASSLDALFTWLVVRKVGDRVEANLTMGYFYRHIGLSTTLVLRVLVGIFLFWLFANEIRGRRYFVTKKTAISFLTLQAGYGFAEYTTPRAAAKAQRLFELRFYLTSFAILFAFLVTWLTVGNDLNVYLYYLHK